MTDPRQQDVYVPNERSDIAPFIPASARSALDVGCGPGGFASTLRATLGPQARILGIDAVASSVAAARERGAFDEVVQGYFPHALADREERFDLISFNDVLEHIVDPWETLRQTTAYLTPGGRVLAAIPNIQFAPVLWEVFRRGWEYQDAGLLDRTHVRFFSRASMIDLFESSGYAVERCEGINSIRSTWATDPLAPRRWLKFALADTLGDRQYLHFAVLARPIGPNQGS